MKPLVAKKHMRKQYLIQPQKEASISQQSIPANTQNSIHTHLVLQLQASIGNQGASQFVEAQHATTVEPNRDRPVFRGLSHELMKDLQSSDSARQQDQENRTGLPDKLKAGIEGLSGIALDDVKVYHNSSKPSEIQASAYTKGTEIYVGPGQAKYLPHEAWYVVQQAQGRVKPTMQIKNGERANDDASLEHEADVMGAKAMQISHSDQDAPISTLSQWRKSVALSFASLSEQSLPLLAARTNLVGPAAKVQSTARRSPTIHSIQGGSNAPIQRVIDSRKQEYADKKQRVKRGAGAGTIIEVVEDGYTVMFDSGESFYVPAADLNLIEDKESPVPAKLKDTDVPAKLKVTQGESNNSWNLELQNVDGKKLGRVLKPRAKGELQQWRAWRDNSLPVFHSGWQSVETA